MPKDLASPLSFPCAFPVKVMADNEPSLARNILEIVSRHAPDYDASTLETRLSSSGKYASLTCVVNAVSQGQLDALYRELSGYPQARVVL